jgi:hypothetical protein
VPSRPRGGERRLAQNALPGLDALKQATKLFGVACQRGKDEATKFEVAHPNRNCANYCLLDQNIIPMPRQIIWIVSAAFRWVVVVILEDYADLSRWNLHVPHDELVGSTIWAGSSDD